MKKNNKKGFTIVELVIVIAVIAILSAIMIPTFGSIIDKANESEALQVGRALYMEVYAEDLSDGKVDGTVSSDFIDSLDLDDNEEVTYTAAGGFVYSNGEWTATYTEAAGWVTAKVQ